MLEKVQNKGALVKGIHQMANIFTYIKTNQIVKLQLINEMG